MPERSDSEPAPHGCRRLTPATCTVPPVATPPATAEAGAKATDTVTGTDGITVKAMAEVMDVVIAGTSADLSSAAALGAASGPPLLPWSPEKVIAARVPCLLYWAANFAHGPFET